MLDEQRVIGEIRAGLAASNVEHVYKWLARAKKNELRVWPKVLAEVVQNRNILARTKKLAVEMLAQGVEDAECRDEVLDSTKSAGFLFGVLSVLHEETQMTPSTFSPDIPEGVLCVLRFFEKLVLACERPGEKDLVVARMDLSGAFFLVNAWAGPELLRMYSAIFRMEDMQACEKIKEGDKRAGNPNHRQTPKEEKDVPYRALVEEKVLDTETLLVHRRKPRMFSPVRVRTCRRNAPETYRRVYRFQDDYEIIHRSLKKWSDVSGSLDGVEWACIHHMNNVISNVERDETYRKELLFLLEPTFHSALMNTVSTPGLAGVKLYAAYLLLLARGGTCGIPAIRGAVSVASERLGLSNARHFLGILKEKKQDPLTKIEAVRGLHLLLLAFPPGSIPPLRKLLEKNVSYILEMLETQPEEGAEATLCGASEAHCSSVISLLAGMESMPLELFRPSSMVLILWVTESPVVESMSEKSRKWLSEYARVLHSTYHNQGRDRLVAGLYF